jgi:Uma2 family endonuclease
MTVRELIDTSTPPQPYRFSRRDYLLLSESGAFDAVAKAELIEGVIVAVNAQFSRHIRAQGLLYRALADACDRLGGEFEAWVEGSVAIDDHSMPQPDIFVSRGLPDEGPVPVDSIALVIEIADTTRAFDLEDKVRLYAGAGLPEYWVADVTGRAIHQMWEASGDAYGERREVTFGGQIGAATIHGLVVDTTGLA